MDLKALAKERGLRDYSRMKKAELIAFIQNNQPTPGPQTRPPRPTRPPPPPPQLVRFRSDRPRQSELLRQPSSREMDIFEQQEMRENGSKVTSKLNDWYDWLVNHVAKTIKDNASGAFKTFKDKVVELYNRVTGNENQTQQNNIEEPREPEYFNPIEREQTFSRAYRSYRINGRPRMDVDTFFEQIRQNLIHLMDREQTDLGSARVQTTAWIRFKQALEDDFGNIIGFDRVELPFNSRTMEIFQGSDFNEIVNEMFAHSGQLRQGSALL